MTTIVKPSAVATLSHWTQLAAYETAGWVLTYTPVLSGDVTAVGADPYTGYNLAFAQRDTAHPNDAIQTLRIERTVTGLTVGTRYRATVPVLLPVNRLVRLGFGGTTAEYKGRLSTTPYDYLTAWRGNTVSEQDERTLTIEWVATATSTSLYLECPIIAGVVPADITIPPGLIGNPLATAPLYFEAVTVEEFAEDVATLPITEGRITLDATWSPFIQATPVTCAVDNPQLYTTLDALTESRVTIAAADLAGGSSRAFDLSLRSTGKDRAAGTVDLHLESDEALVREYTPSFDDTTPLDLADDLRDVVDYVLRQAVPDANLTVPAAPIDVRPRWAVTNLLENPDFAKSAPDNLIVDPDFETVFGTDRVWNREGTTGAWEIAESPEGRGLHLVAGTGANNIAMNDQLIPVQAGGQYKVSARVKTVGVAMSVRVLAISPANTSNGWAVQINAPTAGGWATVEGTFTVPANTDRLRFYFMTANSTGGTGDAWMREPEITRVSSGANPGAVAKWIPLTGTLDRASNALRHTVGGSGAQQVIAVGHPVTPGRTYYGRASVMRAGSGAIRVGVRFRDANGNVIDDPVVWNRGFSVTSNGAWVPCEVFAVAPEDAVTADFGVFWSNASNGEACYVDSPLFTESDFSVPYFYGGTPSDDEYAYQWDGAPNASTSSRRPYAARPPEALVWTPGTSAWSFLEQLLYTTGYRLWCDEERIFHLVPDDAPTATGQITVDETTADNETGSRDNEDYANSITLIYRWSDRWGDAQSETLVAGRGGPGRVITFDDTPYPGGNPAARVLAAAQLAGRTRTTTCPGDLDTTPGMTATFTLPDTAPQTGTIRRVDFDLATGLMDLETHRLQET